MKKCSICDRPHVAKGLCSHHYEKLRARKRYKTQNPTWNFTIQQRLDYYSTPIPESGCHIWIGSVDRDGYGKVYYQNRHDKAHRVSYRLTIGDIPIGMVVCHRCDTPSCINPAHLFLGTPLDNNRDRTLKNRGIKGSLVGISKLSDELVRLIRADGRPQTHIAKDYGVSQASISAIKLGKTWKHILSEQEAS